MKSPLHFACTCGAAVLFAVSAFAEPADEVQVALQDFLDQPNYTWEISSTRGKPEDATPGNEQATKGQHEKGGYTKINFVSGPHILPKGTVSRQPWEGFNDEQHFVSSRWVFATPQGWKLLSELPNPGIPSPSSRSPRPGSISVPIFSGGFSSRSIGIWRPDQEIAIAIANLASVEQVSPGVYQAELTSEGATKFISPPKMGAASVMVGVRKASATIKIWARDGSLLRYELSVDGILSLPIGERPINYSRTRELSHLGTTVIEVPDEVQHKLGK